MAATSFDCVVVGIKVRSRRAKSLVNDASGSSSLTQVVEGGTLGNNYLVVDLREVRYHKV